MRTVRTGAFDLDRARMLAANRHPSNVDELVPWKHLPNRHTELLRLPRRHVGVGKEYLPRFFGNTAGNKLLDENPSCLVRVQLHPESNVPARGCPRVGSTHFRRGMPRLQ